MFKELRRVWSWGVAMGGIGENAWMVLGLATLAVVVPLGYLVWIVVS